VTIVRGRVAGVILLRDPDEAALLQHRDDLPGLAHAGLWVPPGGHCDAGESDPACARREFFEETAYLCADLRFLTHVDLDTVPFSPPVRLCLYWDVYDGRQTPVCQEGQALEFVPRSQATGRAMPEYFVDLWDRAIDAWRASRQVTSNADATL
jgi:8-oxo-dGTP pyrophosphatase MutT (NUDIX family)